MVEESIHVKFDDMISPPRKKVINDDVGILEKNDDRGSLKRLGGAKHK